MKGKISNLLNKIKSSVSNVSHNLGVGKYLNKNLAYATTLLLGGIAYSNIVGAQNSPERIEQKNSIQADYDLNNKEDNSTYSYTQGQKDLEVKQKVENEADTLQFNYTSNNSNNDFDFSYSYSQTDTDSKTKQKIEDEKQDPRSLSMANLQNKRKKIIGQIDRDEALKLRLSYSPEDEAFYSKKASNKIRKEMKKLGKSVTSFYGDQVLNPFVQPNYLNQGNFTLDYYGSGDANGDEIFNFADHTAMTSGTSNDRTDVNGDGVTNTADADLLYDYLTDQIPYLPGHWELLQTSTEKINWEEKVNAIDLTDQNTYVPGSYECDQFKMQLHINKDGIEDIINSGINFNTYDTTMNARFNFPGYGVTTKTNVNVLHLINNVNTTAPSDDFYSYYYVEPQNDAQAFIGGPSLNDYANMERYVYYFNEMAQQYLYSFFDVINFDISSTPTLTWQHPDLIINKPIEFTYIHSGGQNPADVSLNPEDPTGPGDTGYPGAASWATEYYNDISNQGTDPTDSTYHNYNITRTWKAISDFNPIIDTTYSSNDATNFPNMPGQDIEVRDVTNPWLDNPGTINLLYIDYPAGIPTENGGDNCGYFTLTRALDSTNRSTDPSNCTYSNFSEWYTDNIVDPTGNSANASFEANVTDPWVTNPGTINMLYTEYPGAIPDPEGGSNCGNYTLTRTLDSTNRSTDPANCAYFNFSEWYTDNLIDPIGNSANASFEANATLNSDQWDFFPGPNNLLYYLPAIPGNTNGPATASNPAGMPVDVIWDTISYQDPDPNVCEHYNYPLDMIYTKTNSVCTDMSSDSTQPITKYKPNSLVNTFFPDSVTISRNDPIEPWFTGEPLYNDTLEPQFPTGYEFWDEIVSASPTDTTRHRHFNGIENICSTITPDSVQVIKKDLLIGVPENELEKKVKDIFSTSPNPFINRVNVKVDYDFKKIQKINIEVYNSNGMLVDMLTEEFSPGQNSFNVDLSDNPAGMYYAVFSANGKTVNEIPVEVEKLIKIKGN